MYSIKIDGMMCEGCQKRVEGALSSFGASSKVDLEKGMATIAADKDLDISAILEAIEDLGFDAKLIEN